jgi:superfamily II DNA helicase RecQ
VHRFLREDEFTFFAYLCELSHLVQALAKQSVRMPRVIWQNGGDQEFMLDGHLLTMAAFRSMYNTLLSNTTDLLHDEVLLGLSLPNLHHDVIYDDLSNITPGYSFLTDHRNHFSRHRQFLIRAMVDVATSRNRFVYQTHSNASGVAWNVRGVRDWTKVAENCLMQMFLLYHYGAGQAGRGTELTILAWINTLLHPRNCYWFDDMLNFVTLYNKTQTATERQRLISRSLEPRAAQLFIEWATFVVPTLVCLSACLQAPSIEGAARFHTLIFTSMNREWDSDDLSSILSAASGEPVADGGLGYPMGLADTRHFLIAIMRKRFRNLVDKYGLAEEIFNEQSGHGDDVAIGYAIDSATIQNFPEERLHNFAKISRLHHTLIADPASIQPMPIHVASSSHQAQMVTSVTSLSTSDLRQISSQLAPIVAHEIAVQLAPKMQTNIADGFAAIVPIDPSTSHNQRASRESDLELIDVDEVVLNPARHAELQALYGEKARFRSKAQAAAVELSARREKDLLVVMATGGGKSLVFMAAAKNQVEIEQRLMTVIVVPLKALLLDLRRRLREKDIKVIVWESGKSQIPHDDTRSILVTVDKAAEPEFFQFISNMIANKRLARMILDEIHSILTSEHYRPLFKFLKELRRLCVTVVGMSGTCPPSALKELCSKLHILPTATQIIRMPAIRANIVYRRLELVTPATDGLRRFDFRADDSTVQNIVTYIGDKAGKLAPGDRILGFVLSRADAESLAGELSCFFYHAKMSDVAQAQTLEDWQNGRGSPILISTSALGNGLDCSVRIVFHYKSARNHIDHDQEIGRAGRDDQLAYSIVFWDPSDYGWRPKEGQSLIGIKEQQAWLRTDQCLRIITGQFLDGKGRSCIDMGTVQLCGWCSAHVHLTHPGGVKHPTRIQLIQTALDMVNSGRLSSLLSLPTYFAES